MEGGIRRGTREVGSSSLLHSCWFGGWGRLIWDLIEDLILNLIWDLILDLRWDLIWDLLWLRSSVLLEDVWTSVDQRGRKDPCFNHCKYWMQRIRAFNYPPAAEAWCILTRSLWDVYAYAGTLNIYTKFKFLEKSGTGSGPGLERMTVSYDL